MLTQLSTGAVCYIPMTSVCKPMRLRGGLIDGLCKYILNTTFDTGTRIVNIIGKLKYATGVCLLSNNVREQFTLVRACGSSAKILLRRKQIGAEFVLLQLPSLAYKIIPTETPVFIGHVRPRKKKFIKNTRAGFWRNIGVKPQVRGVVKNPIDHPNGGRARTVFRPKTPWGKIAK